MTTNKRPEENEWVLHCCHPHCNASLAVFVLFSLLYYCDDDGGGGHYGSAAFVVVGCCCCCCLWLLWLLTTLLFCRQTQARQLPLHRLAAGQSQEDKDPHL